MAINVALLKSSIPMLVAAVAAVGSIFSPAFAAFLAANPSVIGFIVGGLSLYFPSTVAAVKYENSAD